MAGVERAEVVEVRVRRAEGGRGEETGRDGVLRVFRDFAEEPQHGRRAVGLAEPAPEPGAADEAEPGLADEGGADEERGLERREAEEGLLLQLLRQRRRRRRHAGFFFEIIPPSIKKYSWYKLHQEEQEARHTVLQLLRSNF